MRLLIAGLWALVWRLGALTVSGLLLSVSVLASGYNWNQWLEGESPISKPDSGWGDVVLFIGVILVFPILGGLLTRMVVVARSSWRAAGLLLLLSIFAWILKFELASYYLTIDYANTIQTGGTFDTPLIAERPVLVLALLGVALSLGGLGWQLGRLITVCSRWIGGSPLRRGLKRARKQRVRVAGG